METALGLLRRIADTEGPPEPTVPPGYSMAGDAEDAGDLLEVVADPDDCLPAELFIRYADGDGNGSLRSITLRSVKRTDDGGILLSCYCHLRAAPRTLHAGRIIEAIDSVSGEDRTPPTGFLDYWGMNTAPAPVPDGTLEALKAARHGVVVLTFLSRCDGRQHPSDIEVIVEYLVQHAYRYEIDVSRLAEFMARLKPDVEAFRESAEILAAGEGESSLETVLMYAGRLIQADGVMHEAEEQFARELMAYRRTGDGPGVGD